MTLWQVVVQTPPPPLPPVGNPVDWTYVLSEFAPVIGFTVFAVLAALAMRWFFRSPIAEAIGAAVRARTRQRFGGGADELDAERVAGLEHHVTALQGQLAELAERVDFAERMLADRRERKLSAGQ